ncbi:MAG TPA: T9SS type A sorting domain-containing protein, partial [Candidatus Marinimicrobia bacterium]|nr:T9SS type A sorting domain-containing protein [Candidatus Neomarinimicrobiota bacterium]
NTWNSPTPIFYNYTGGSYHKNYLGNYYSDYAGTDGDGNGIGNSAYTEGGTTDNYPLMATSDHYSLQAWWLSGDSKMYRADMTKSPGVVAITGGSSQIWSAEEATLANISFSGTDGWTGQVIFTSPIANNDSFKIEIGYSSNGSDFNTGGPNATIIRDGSDSVFTYQTNASAFTVPEGNYLALRITNNSSSNYAVQTGGASSYCSAPNESQDYSLPVELASFNATAGNGNITLKWITESEIENLGFNIYRSTSRDGEFVMLNAKLIAGAGSSSESHEYSYIDRDVKSGLTYWYKLEDVDYNGKTEFHGPISAVLANTTPTEFGLHKNYPNPFNPVTTISYDLAKDVYVELAVYNILGGKVITLVNGNQPAGSYQLEWDGRDSRGLIVSSGMYLLRINAGNYCKTNKMVFVR